MMIGSRQIGPRQIGPRPIEPLADLAANWAPHFMGPNLPFFGKLGPGKLGPGHMAIGPYATNMGK